jgi:hypothetical protein
MAVNESLQVREAKLRNVSANRALLPVEMAKKKPCENKALFWK